MILPGFSLLTSYSNEHLKFLKSDFKNFEDERAESRQSGVASREGKIGIFKQQKNLPILILKIEIKSFFHWIKYFYFYLFILIFID